MPIDRRREEEPHAPADLAAAPDLTLAEKIDRLFRTVHPRDRGEFTYREVEAGIRELSAERARQAGRDDPEGSLSASYICQLRKGKRTNPTLKQIELLAAFFKVPVTYFIGTPEQVETIDAQMSLVRALRDHEVREIALRVSSLNPVGIRAVADLITSLQTVPGMTRTRSRRRPQITDDAEAP
jgi:transcriptional regulator with XRE-family HTH domain